MEDAPSGTPRPRRGESTRHRLLEAAVAQLATEGMRGLTHRRVEARAGVAQGSAKHHFGSLEALIEAVLEHMVAVDLPLVVDAGPDTTAAEFTARAQAVMDAVLDRPDLIRARFELYLYAADRPHLQTLVLAARERFVTRIAESLPGPDAATAARYVCAVLDGLLLAEVSAPDPSLARNAGLMLTATGLAGRLLAARVPLDLPLPPPEPTP